jgi:hypothetical protein
MKFGKLKYLICSVFSACAISSSLSAATAAQIAQLNVNNDSGLWLEENIIVNLPLDCFNTCDPCGNPSPKEWLLTLHGEQRWASNFEVQYYWEQEQLIEKDFARPLKDWFSFCDDSWFKNLYFGPGLTEYEQISKQNYGPGLTKWNYTFRIFAEADLKLSLWDWAFNQRFRYEWNMALNPNYHSYNDFRYKIEFVAPWKFTSFNIQAWIANEFFFRKKTYQPATASSEGNPSGLVGNFFEDRFRVGILGMLTEHLQLKIWYQARFLEEKISATNNKEWWTLNHLGITLSAIY